MKKFMSATVAVWLTMVIAIPATFAVTVTNPAPTENTIVETTAPCQPDCKKPFSTDVIFHPEPETVTATKIVSEAVVPSPAPAPTPSPKPKSTSKAAPAPSPTPSPSPSPTPSPSPQGQVLGVSTTRDHTKEYYDDLKAQILSLQDSQQNNGAQNLPEQIALVIFAFALGLLTFYVEIRYQKISTQLLRLQKQKSKRN